MTAEEYYNQLREDRAQEWARLLKNGRHPTWEEIAGALFCVGLEPASDAARYVARRVLPKGHPDRISAPRGNNGKLRSDRPDDASLALLYNFDLQGLRALRKFPKAYAKAHEGAKPAEVARRGIAEEFNAPEETIRIIRKKRGR